MNMKQGMCEWTNREVSEMLNRLIATKFGPVSTAYGGLPCVMLSEATSDESIRGRFPESADLLTCEGNTRVEWGGRQFDVKRVILMAPKEFDSAYLDAYPNVGDQLANIDDFVSMVVVMFHEYQHVKHYLVDINEKHDMGKFLEYASQQGNNRYYIQNYFLWSTDAECQYRGLFDAYRWFEGICGDEAEGLILRYQSRRFGALRESQDDGISADQNDFIPAPEEGDYQNINDLFEAYERRCRELVHSHKTYDCVAGRDSGDVAGMFFWGWNPDVYPEHKDEFRRKNLCDMFNKEHDGMRQAKMIASMHPKVRLSQTDELGLIKRTFKVDLRIASVFGIYPNLDGVRYVWDSLPNRGPKIRDSKFESIVADMEKDDDSGDREPDD